MAKAGKRNPTPKTQPLKKNSISNYFLKTKTAHVSSGAISSDQENQHGDDDNDEGDEADIEVNSKPLRGRKTKKEQGIDEDADMEVGSEDEESIKKDGANLPPITDISKMFADIVGRTPKLKGLTQHVVGRKLRVATMCSGTESPLLALAEITTAIRNLYDIDLQVQHVFSCEIEPFKQAYIERNFSPPLLFRDVCELGHLEAHTAYGALASVPGDVDMLVAGTSCVDYSNLNNEKQDIDANGESGATFRGMMSWVTNHRPPIVILENVCGAPWARICEKFAKHGYSASWSRVDTKQYYIPHTRTRVYLLAVDAKRSDIPERWKALVRDLRRPASSTLDEFLLPGDDFRIHQSRQKIAQEVKSSLTRRKGRTDWGKCESRHARARLEEFLGNKRPFTNWEDGGSCKLPDYSWNEWGLGQVERVWDLIEIATLREAHNGVDPSYKTTVWNLSQNVDRSIGGKMGLSPCMTPTMIPYITNRGGPMIGLEALWMQGLPVEKLLLTRESEDQLLDLAGNAMSTTVVGTCMIAALLCAQDLLKPGADKMTYESKRGLRSLDSKSEDNDIEMSLNDGSDAVVGTDQLVRRPLPLSSYEPSTLHTLLTEAESSVRLCTCEGRTDITSSPIFRCIDCGHTSCMRCVNRREHNFGDTPISISRTLPSQFSLKLREVLPMVLGTNLTRENLDTVRAARGSSISEKIWRFWSTSVLRAISSQLRFSESKRKEVWTVIYRSPFARLELALYPKRPEWRLFALPQEYEPANALVRTLLKDPIARLFCQDTVLGGTWELALPEHTTIPLHIEGTGGLIPSWESRLGLTSEALKDKQVYAGLRISLQNAKDTEKLDRNISGSYIALPQCGTACSALHKKVDDTDDSLLPLFLLMDPARTVADDPFVFSTSIRRYEYAETRPRTAKLDSEWRPSDKAAVDVDCYLPCTWVKVDGSKLQPPESIQATFGARDRSFEVESSITGCQTANALLVCSASLSGNSESIWPVSGSRLVDKIHERVTFQELAWMIERPRCLAGYDQWNEVHSTSIPCHCERCAPTPPILEWRRTSRNKVCAVEDPIQAGEYERRLKSRPTPFVTELKRGTGNVGTVQIGLNVSSLLHRAVATLPIARHPEEISLSWKLSTDYVPTAVADFPPFTIMSNKLDKKHAQPPGFRVKLRPEQLRSLEWMVKQESLNTEPFVEEEISEAILEPLGWRAEGRARRPKRVRGGVLADAVGYGKTAITLALIACTRDHTEEEFSKMEDFVAGKISSQASIIYVPPHLTKQWAAEVVKFAGKHFKVVVISTMANLNKLTINEIRCADIICVASNLAKSDAYLQNLQSFAGCETFPNQEGRHFNAHLDKVLEALKEQTARLCNEGPSAVLDNIKEANRKIESVLAAVNIQTKRLKGKQFRDAQLRKGAVTNKDLKVEVQQDDEDLLEHRLADRTPSGKIMEVVIPKRKLPDVSSRRRVFRSKANVILSDDEESDVTPTRRKYSRAISEDDDFIADSDSGDDDEEVPISERSSFVDDDSDDDSDDVPTPKSKKIRPSKSKSHQDRSSSGAGDEAMDIDEELASSKPKKTTKRKSTGQDTQAAKKAKRIDSDPWKLNSCGTWDKMMAPPLEMFNFARKVVDEYTYLDGKVHSLITRVTAERSWVLSGTPPIHDFAAVKTISSFVGIHLGVDDNNEGESLEIRRRIREQTVAEKFHSFREVHSREWHAHRHEVGQEFLNRFVRQNIAEIDEIPCNEKFIKVDLPAAERAIYLELEHYLRALDMVIKRGKKTESDRDKRINQSFGESRSAEEALLKRCSHFDLDTSNENAMKACDVIVRDRQNQLEDCKTELLARVKEASALEKTIPFTGSESLFSEWVRVSRAGEAGDQEASEALVSILVQAKVPIMKPPKKEEVKLTENQKKQVWAAREKTHDLRRLTKELVVRIRSLRYFTAVRDLQREQAHPQSIVCPLCKRTDIAVEDAIVISSCGHMGCSACVAASAAKEECILAESGICKCHVRSLNLIRAETLGVDDVQRDGKGRHFGLKLETVVELIRDTIIPNGERVLVFVQFDDLLKKVTEAFEYHKIKFLQIKGSATQRSKNLQAFQDDSKEKVLLLTVTDESASGANLTSANHAIFLSPLLTESKEIYKASMTQAVGRLVRYGQQKEVQLYRFMSTSTIDEEIYDQRRKEGVEVER